MSRGRGLGWEREEWSGAVDAWEADREEVAAFRRFAGGIEIVGDREDCLDEVRTLDVVGGEQDAL